MNPMFSLFAKNNINTEKNVLSKQDVHIVKTHQCQLVQHVQLYRTLWTELVHSPKLIPGLTCISRPGARGGTSSEKNLPDSIDFLSGNFKANLSGEMDGK
jgi:hypothetical protein